jgi:5-formyltetrahydrofolate cyclo-ligase
MDIKKEKDVIRERVWQRMKSVAKPDSRFHFNFSEFIPDYKGSEACTSRFCQTDLYRDSKLLMITPDNNLKLLREQVIKDKKVYIMPTGGIKRGFLMFSHERIPQHQEEFAATLDGAEIFGLSLSLSDIMKFGESNGIDLMVTGASAVSVNGVRYGKGHGYFDIEWAMFREIRVVEEETPIVAFVHDFQVLEDEIQADAFDTVIDLIVTPTRIIKVTKEGAHQKPKGIIWKQLPKDLLQTVPPLQELYEITFGKQYLK